MLHEMPTKTKDEKKTKDQFAGINNIVTVAYLIAVNYEILF
jgi:hypothetical protein